ncbi:four-carbon acid sugar kinase family protein [Roseinatronobacter alkalisoli]|uniref:Four-carbon acid sugar kinase family protein n=1 Tax=Roseinatronobacter alkalisoli TaxID=3028235 RepID=A0ABT5TB91_9RHOB|nr:four-carbon acid sugar kinase family protein [Roseinatronobacter sp. HJB301]MDD7972404.1 four-carbon acid sugar kinase family protein [Roseinatronobacter sp. HJB301]
MQRIAIIADDLTGALDSAAAFAMQNLTTRVVTETAGFIDALRDPGLQVVAVSTGTREGTADNATATICMIGASLQEFDGLVFKKVDSRLKGHVAAEIAQLRRFRHAPPLACPAIPRLNRFVIDGAVTGAGVPVPIDVAGRVGIARTIVDATTDSDIDAALPSRLDDNLYIGAAGLAEALARRLAGQSHCPPLPPLPVPLLLAIGSRDPVTLSQLDAMSQSVVAAPDGIVPSFALHPVTVIQMTENTPDLDPGLAADSFATGIASALRNGPRSLFACGGETAQAILKHLGIVRLDLLGEVLPGVPLSRCADTGLIIVTKSGGFGTRDLLSNLIAHVDSHRPTTTPPATAKARPDS